MKFLKQSTATVIAFGPALLPADGVTLVTTLVSALDHASTGIFLCKNGATAAIRHATVTATTYDSYGSYLVTLDTTDTGTLGRLRVMFAAAASTVPIWEDFTVLAANIYDSLIGGGDTLAVNTTKLGGTTQTGRDVGLSVLLSSGTGTGQVSLSSGTVTAGTVSDKTGYGLSSAAVQAIWDALTSALTTVGSIGKLIVTNLDTTISSRSSYAGGDTSGVTTLLSRVGGAITLSGGAVTVGTNNDKTGYTASTVSDKTGYSLSAGAIQAIWDALTSALTTVGSVGKLIVDNVNATISSRSTYSGGAVASVTAGVIVTTNNDKTGYTASTVSDKTGYTLTTTPATSADVLTQVNAALDTAGTELTAVPTTTGTLRQKIAYLHQYFRNRKTITSTTETLYKEDASTSLSTATLSDDGTTFVKGEGN